MLYFCLNLSKSCSKREVKYEEKYGKDTEQYKPDGIDAGSLSYVAHPADGYTLDGGQLINAVEELGALIPDETLTPINEIAYNVAESMSNDENFKEDLNASIVIEGTKAWDEEEVQEENNETTNQAGKPNANANPNPKPSQNVPVKIGDQAPIVLTSVLLVGSAVVLLLLKLRKNNK